MEMNEKQSFFGYIVSFLNKKILMIRIFDPISDFSKDTHPKSQLKQGFTEMVITRAGHLCY